MEPEFASKYLLHSAEVMKLKKNSNTILRFDWFQKTFTPMNFYIYESCQKSKLLIILNSIIFDEAFSNCNFPALDPPMKTLNFKVIHTHSVIPTNMKLYRHGRQSPTPITILFVLILLLLHYWYSPLENCCKFYFSFSFKYDTL